MAGFFSKFIRGAADYGVKYSQQVTTQNLRDESIAARDRALQENAMIRDKAAYDRRQADILDTRTYQEGRVAEQRTYQEGITAGSPQTQMAERNLESAQSHDAMVAEYPTATPARKVELDRLMAFSKGKPGTTGARKGAQTNEEKAKEMVRFNVTDTEDEAMAVIYKMEGMSKKEATKLLFSAKSKANEDKYRGDKQTPEQIMEEVNRYIDIQYGKDEDEEDKIDWGEPLRMPEVQQGDRMAHDKETGVRAVYRGNQWHRIIMD